ncbi:MAG: thiamine phosphate synthase, partial [Pseudomonas sp.]
VTLSPVLPTATHPDAAPLGWERAQELIGTVNLPVYVLGGVEPGMRNRAFEIGAQGVAGIRRFWG